LAQIAASQNLAEARRQRARHAGRNSRPPRDGARNFDKPRFDKPRYDKPREDRGGDERPRFSRPREDRPRVTAHFASGRSLIAPRRGKFLAGTSAQRRAIF